jgi:hypothetical protein
MEENMVELTEVDLERRAIQEPVAILEKDELYRLDDIIAQYGSGLTLRVETDWYYDDCTITIHLDRDRLETDEEYEARLVQLRVYRAKQAEANEKRRKTREARKAKKESDEHKLYETLKAKFEKG